MAYIPASVMIRAILQAGHTQEWLANVTGISRPAITRLLTNDNAQKGLPAFGIYGHDVQNADDTEIPEDVKEKLLRFGRAAVAVASMRGNSYLQIGSVCMGIGGSIIDPSFIGSILVCALSLLTRLRLYVE